MRVASFAKAAQEYEEAVGGSLSAMSVWRITQKAGQQVAQQQAEEAMEAVAPAKRDEKPGKLRLREVAAVEECANISTDGGMIHVRNEGWKEVKIATVSQIDVRADGKTGDQEIGLHKHSYTAALMDADSFAPYQYAEGVRRGLERVKHLSSVNDGALWIERITETNFPHAIQIVDWYHAKSRLHQVAHEVYKQRKRANRWLDQCLAHLHQGQVDKVQQALDTVPLQDKSDVVRSTPGYFQHNRTRMRYDYFRRLDLPIGSGTVESAVQHVIQHRMHRPGRGWSRTHVNGMLALLTEYHSNRLRRTWSRVISN